MKNLKKLISISIAIVLTLSIFGLATNQYKTRMMNTPDGEWICLENGVCTWVTTHGKETIEKVAAQKAEEERLAAEEAQRAEQERLAAERAAAEAAAKKAEEERLAAERAAAEKAAAEAAAKKAEEERLAAEKAAAEAAAKKAEEERLAAERAAAEANKASEQNYVTVHAEEQINNGHGYTKEEVHSYASKYKQDISTVSTHAANEAGNVLKDENQKMIENEIYKLMNETRAKVNAAPLTRTELNSETWAEMMLETGLFEHAKLFNTYSYENGQKVVEKEAKAGVGTGWAQAGENIAWRAYSPDEMAATYLNGQWNKSQGHYLNRINAAWTYYDVSVVKGADGQWYAVERFAR